MAESYGILEDRALRCLERMVGAFVSHLLDAPEEMDRALRRFPLSLLEDALVALQREPAARLIEEEDLQPFARRVRAVEWLVADDTPYYTLAELAGHVEAFRSYLQQHRDYLVRTGLPPRSFRECRWLYLRLARLYDTRSTGSPWPPDEFIPNSRRAAASEPYTWVKTPSPHVVCTGRDITACQYHEADYLKGLGQDDADRLEAKRDRLFEVKLRALGLLGEAARKRDVGALWPSFLKTLADAYTPDDVAFFFKMDRFYLGTDALDGSDEGPDAVMVPGGLTNWIEALGHVEKEVRIGTLDRARAAMPGPLLQKLTAADESCRECRWAYLRVVGTADKAPLDAILRQVFRRLEQERAFWDDFRWRVKGSLSGEFRVPVSVFVPLDAATWMPSRLQQRADELAEAGASPAAATGSSAGADRAVARFPSPEGLRWQEVTMEFVSETELTISARGVMKCYNFAELGFRDGRAKRQVRPDRLWKFFRVLAENKGELSWDTKKAEEFKSHAIKYTQRLRDRLQAVMGLGAPPIPNYDVHKKYKTAFTLHASTMAQNIGPAKEDDD